MATVTGCLGVVSLHRKFELFSLFSYIVFIALLLCLLNNIMYESIQIHLTLERDKFSVQTQFGVNSKDLSLTTTSNEFHRNGYALERDNTSIKTQFGAIYTPLLQNEYSGNTSKSNLSQQYHNIGVQMNFATNLELFQEIFSGSNSILRHLPERPPGGFQNTTNITNLIGRITLEYHSFNFSSPHFISMEDKDVFFMSQINADHLFTRTEKHLTGDIGILYFGTIEKRLHCGYANSLTDYQLKTHPESLKSSYMTEQQDDIIIPLLIPDGWAFQHFIDGALPKLAQISPFLSNPRVKVMIHKPRDAIIMEILQQIGIPRGRVLFYTGSLTIARYQLNTCVTPPLQPQLWAKMRELLGVHKHLQVPMREASVILLTRAKSHNGGRNILNQDEVISYLLHRYNQTFVLFNGGYNLSESKAIFGKARLVLGVHGGAFYNINFSPVEAIVAEYLPASKSHNTAFKGVSSRIIWSMANMIGQRFYRIYETPIHGSDLQVSISKLERLLDEIDEIHFGERRNSQLSR